MSPEREKRTVVDQYKFSECYCLQQKVSILTSKGRSCSKSHYSSSDSLIKLLKKYGIISIILF